MNSLFKKIIILILFLFFSCEKDFVSFDSQVINSENAINFSTTSIDYSLATRSEMVNPVQTNNLPSCLLGSYIHPQCGRSNSSFGGQFSGLRRLEQLAAQAWSCPQNQSPLLRSGRSSLHLTIRLQKSREHACFQFLRLLSAKFCVKHR